MRISKFLTQITAATLLLLTSILGVAGDARTGSLKGLNNHVSSGTVTVMKDGDSVVIDFGEDFVFDGAPDPKVAFGKDGKYDPATLIKLLESNSGAQRYTVPATINAADYNEVYIWCEKYSVGLAVAPIQ